MTITKVSSNGRVTLPLSLRKYYRLQAGDQIKFVAIDGGYMLQVIKSVKAIKGVLSTPSQSVSIEKMNQAIADMAVSNYKEVK